MNLRVGISDELKVRAMNDECIHKLYRPCTGSSHLRLSLDHLIAEVLRSREYLLVAVKEGVQGYV